MTIFRTRNDISAPSMAVHEMPDPKDFAYPSQYAALVATTHLIVASFNERIELGLPRAAPARVVLDCDELARRPKVFDRVPAWAEAVQSSGETLYVPRQGDRMIQEDNKVVSPGFKKYNINMARQHIDFI